MKSTFVPRIALLTVVLVALARCGTSGTSGTSGVSSTAGVGGTGGSSPPPDAAMGGAGGSGGGVGGSATTDASLSDGSRGSIAAQKIQHVIVIMQENRSFDHYFGTFPGAEGIPMDANGVPTVCVMDPKTNTCVQPYHLTADKNTGGPHQAASATTCID